MNFFQKLGQAIEKNNSLLCVGLDTDFAKISDEFKKQQDPMFAFNKSIIDATKDLVSCYKLNTAFYEARGIDGAFVMKKTLNYIKEAADVPAIADAKRADIGNTSRLYAQSFFDFYKFDAITVNPYLGFDAIEPFIEYKDKGIIILCRTSNKSAAEFQDLLIDGKPLYINVAKKVTEWHKKHNNCALVVGATSFEEIREIRHVASELFFLVPGIGAQGGDLEKTMQNGLREDKSGLLIHSARSIIFSQNPRNEAKKLRDEINTYR